MSCDEEIVGDVNLDIGDHRRTIRKIKNLAVATEQTHGLLEA